MQETLYLITLKTIKHMKFSTKAATFLSSIKTQTYDKKESEMIITYQQKRVFHLSLLMLALCAPIYIYSVPFPNEQFYYITATRYLWDIGSMWISRWESATLEDRTRSTSLWTVTMYGRPLKNAAGSARPRRVSLWCG